MIYCNFWFIKDLNGMAFYGVDFVNAIADMGYEIILIKRRNVRLPIMQRSNVKIYDANFYQFLRIYILILFTRAVVYCPTLHGLPFVKKQVITLHDAYPFEKSSIKKIFNKIIFKCMLMNRNLTVATINKSIRKSLISYKIKNFVYAPNSIMVKGQENGVGVFDKPNKLRVGLIGTDSDKKNYASLFNAYLSEGTCKKNVSFMIYGSFNPYVENLLQKYPELSLTFFNSSDMDLETFIHDEMDVLVSVAKHEGFCRPICYALLKQKPCLLINDPVFEEFYSEFADILDSESKIIQKLLLGDVSRAKNYQDVLKFVEQLNLDCVNSQGYIVKTLLG